MGVAVLSGHVFVVFASSSHVLVCEASTGRLQQRHHVEGLQWPWDMAAIKSHHKLVICDLCSDMLYLLDVLMAARDTFLHVVSVSLAPMTTSTRYNIQGNNQSQMTSLWRDMIAAISMGHSNPSTWWRCCCLPVLAS